MGKITKTMQPKHRETLSPWLRDFVQAASTVSLPELPKLLDTFPVARWPLPRGDLYHWIPLLNRFDNILECFNKVYQLNEGPQARDFGCDVLLGRGTRVEEYGSDGWDEEKLKALGYEESGDSQLVQAVLQFTRRLLNHCGNRSIYASSSHLNDLLNSTCLSVIQATLEVGLELAQRYQASVKRMTQPSRQVSNALLANHYNIELDRVQQIAQSFVKTPIITLTDSSAHSTPASAGKGKDKDKAQPSASKNAASMIANDLGSVVSTDDSSDGRWKGWGDLKVVYYPRVDGEPAPQVSSDRVNASAPNTPTPLRRSTTIGAPHQTPHQTPRAARATQSSDDTPSPAQPSPAQPSPAVNADGLPSSSQKSVEIPQGAVASSSIYDLLKRTPSDMPKNSQYEFLNRSRICKALLGGPEARQRALAVRLLAIANLAYIHPEFVFVEQVLKQDNDEPRRYHLVYQLVELIHPSTPGQTAAPRSLQKIALSLLEAISHFNAKYQDVISALNATVNHGVLLYVIRKAVAEMKEETEQSNGESVELDDWRDNLFSLALHLAMNGRVGGEMINAGFMDVLVSIINMRTKVAERLHSTAVSYVDALVLNYAPAAFNSFISANGLDAIAELMIDATSSAKSLAEAGQGTKPEFYSSVVDYEIPYVQQQTLKWLLKFIHHIMNPSNFAQNTNTDRLLRNLVDNSKLLGSLRTIMENTKAFGSVVWTNSINLLTDFINNDPTSFAAISETGMVKSLLESLTGREVSTDPAAERKDDEQAADENGPPAEESVVLPSDERPHPPTPETLRAQRPAPLAGGILPSSEATAVIIPVINSICLNNVGLRLVASSRVLESFLEVFESPEHVRIMGIDSDLAYNIGLQFDELARHHPALRQTVANAVIDMISRIKHLGTVKAETAGWGAKLFATDLEGKVVPADHGLLQKAGVEPPSTKGKEVATSAEDVEMTDIAGSAQDSSSQQSDPQPGAKTPDNITPYINALASFLNAYISNSSLRTSLTKSGGIEYLLDIMVSPSLPHQFADSTALGLLQQVLANIIEHAPVVGMPSLLNRIRATMSSLEPLLSSSPSPSFFQPFVKPGVSLGRGEQGAWDVDLVHQVSSGTDVAKALLNIQSLLKTLWSCFPYQSRHSSVSLPAVNVYDHFHEVVKALGPLLRVVLSEEISLITLVPQHWTARKLANVRPGSPSELLMGEQDISLAQMLGGAGLDLPADQADSSRQNRPSTEEQSTAQYQNYQILRVLLQSLMPSAYSFFQTLGKALMTRRERDAYARAKHMQLADALAETVLDQLEPLIDRSLSKSDLQYCIIMLHIIHEMLVDSTRHSDRPGSSVIVPVLDAFKQRRGFDILNKLLNVFTEELVKEHDETDEAPANAKLASIGTKKILDLYSVVVNGKNLAESIQHLNVANRTNNNRSNEWFQTINQFVVEVRMSVFPTVADLWRSTLIDKASTDVVGKIVDILKTVCQGETEGSALRRGDLAKAVPLFKREQTTFPWSGYAAQAGRLAEEYPEDLAREAVYRAVGVQENASEYCRMHQRGLAGECNPIPSEDAYQVTSPAANGSASQTPASSRSSDLLREAMNVDQPPELAQLIGDALVAHDISSDSRESEAPTQQDDDGSSSTPVAAPPTAVATSTETTEQDPANRPLVCKEDLDAEREKLRKDLIDRCLDVIRAHPNSVFEVSELINVTLDRQDSEDAREEVGETLANALMSYALDDEEKTTNGRSIAAYAHLLSLMLHGSPRFFKSTVKTLKDNVSEYLSFLKVPPGNSNEELPPWIPHILLIFEMLLADDAQPVEAKWTPPATENDKIEDPVLQAKEPIIPEEQRATLLESVLEILPRIGKNENLAVAVLRVLVILTRKRSVASIVGERRNLQRLFVMTKQLSGLGSARLKDSTVSGNVMTVLRHVVEDDETLRQIMRSEIRGYMVQMSSRNPRAVDIPAYTRSLAHVALRSPDIFIEVTNETVTLVRFSTTSDPSGPAARGVALTLKEKPSDKSSASVPVSESVEPAVQATEELTIDDVKPTTEPADKEMTDAAKSSAAEPKRPVVENPDGVVHFLLCELLNYREVADKEPSALDTAKETNTSGDDPGAASSEATPVDEHNAENKEKKAPKASFKAEEHPIFVYRCFLLHCLAELLQSYTSKKMEFINFKRNAPTFANTPVKPRSGVLNYLLNDLLCTSSLTSPQDSVAAKKKAATSEQARQVLVALVAKTNERPVDKNRDRFDYDDDSDLLFVRKWVLDMILRAYKDASLPSEPFDVRYAKLLSLAELMINMMGDKADSASPRFSDNSTANRSHWQLKRLMYEKSFLPALTSSIADIDLTFPGVKRTIKYILRVLQIMTSTGIALSHANLLPSGPQDTVEDEIMSASSLSDLEDDREETPDLYRNSALGMLEAGREDGFDDDSDEDEDEEMYDDEFPDELEYGDEMSQDGEEDVSDEDEELGQMGEIEGLPGDPVGVEVIMDDDDDDEDDDDEDMDEDELSDDDEDEGDDDEMGSDMEDDMDDRIEIVDEEGNPLDDDGGSWESETDDEDEGDEDDEGQAYEDGVHDLDELANMPNPLHELQELMQDDHPDGHHHHHHHILAEEGFNFGGDRYDDEAEDDDDEDEQVDVEDDYIYDYPRPGDEIAPPAMPAGLGWDALVVERGPPRPRRSPFPVGPFVIGGGPRGGDPLGGMSTGQSEAQMIALGAQSFEQEMTTVLSRLITNRRADPATDFRSYFRSRAPGPAANQDDGLNPLLRRGANNARDASPRPLGSNLQRPFGGGLHSFLDSPMSILSDLMANLPPGIAGRTPHLSFQIQGPGGRGEIQEFSIPLRAGQHSRDVRTETRREVYQEPQQAVGFTPATTEQRWSDEARLVFGHMNQEKATRLNTYIWATLLPYAAECERKKKAEEAERRRKEEEERQKRHEEERKAREAKEAEERIAREKAEAEERERLERVAAEAAEAAAQAGAEDEEPSAEGSEDAEPQPMEGVETADDSQQPERQEPGPPQPRVVTTIRGEEVDVTELGIDPEYLAAIPEDLREEVIAQTVTSRRTEARANAADSSAGEQGEAFQEFLDALPEDIRHEIVQAERHERRRAEREAQRRQTATIGHAPAAQDMDAASILATLPPDLRQTVLMEQGNEIMDQLPPDLAEEARALAERYHRTSTTSGMLRTRDAARNAPEPAAGTDNKVQRRAIVQMLDKAGVATLLRLMFVSQQGSIRSHLFRVLGDICENRQNRFEVIGSLLQILQFGSTDMEAVERSFSSLSLKAKQPKDKEKDKDFKTPQSLKRTFTNISSTNNIQQNSEISPLLVVQQCLDLLVELSGRNPHIPSLFLTEHENIAVSLKQAHRGKGKGKDLKVHKYAINSLLHLLDRDLVMESSTVMQLLVDLLNKVTLPLQALERRRKEADEEARKEAEKAKEAKEAKEGAEQAEGAPAVADTAQESSAAQTEAPAESGSKPTETSADKAQPEQKKVRQLQPPFIPPENLKLVVKIFVARECSSKTFQNTISTIKNLSNIPEAKQAFGRELVKQAQLLSKNIVSELDELMPHISKAESGTEIQGLALAKFSPGASEQNKLLRVLTALDHLFETKKDESRDSGDAAAADEKSSLLMTLYHNETFNKMWEKLSGCLAAIRQRDNMLNVATILLPLIESLMVVCKNTTLEDGPQSKSQFNKDMVLSSPPPEDAMAGLFFTFTNEHRRILNELVRQNNKLMSGTFSLLVKNPKVLEFDNKRSYFTRTVHAKHGGHTRQAYPPLGVNVRRDNVFHDSYRALAFKSDEEVKHGKLNVRFHGEEGVDAGGVTREWFQVLTRAMFNPDYILFTPVSADRTTFHPNKSSHYNEEHLAFFKFIGRIIGKAVYEGRLLDCYFSRAVYKRILGKPVSVKDMESFDPDYYKSLVWMLENDITNTVIESFSVEEDEFGASKVVDLIENGRNIEVTNENKHEYVRLIVEHKLLSSVKIQMEHFLQGFHGVIPADLIAIFNEQELELLISGLPDIDVDDWKSNTEYHNYTAASQQIQWFWRAVRSFDKEERAKLLQFVTGTSKVPLNGFKELEGMNGVNRFNIHRDYGNKDRLPSSHTCFNQLDLPEYESYEALRGQVIKAITTGGDYFGFA